MFETSSSLLLAHFGWLVCWEQSASGGFVEGEITGLGTIGMSRGSGGGGCLDPKLDPGFINFIHESLLSRNMHSTFLMLWGTIQNLDLETHV